MDGDIGSAQVDVLAKARTPVTEAAFERDEVLLVEKAKQLKFDEFSMVAAYWNQAADPDGASKSDMERRAHRDVSAQFEHRRDVVRRNEVRPYFGGDRLR